MQARKGAFGVLVAVTTVVVIQTASAEPPSYSDATRAYNLAHGRVVFTENCLRCHGCGRRGAPLVDDADDWRERVGQPLDTLIRHAIDGHGRMPPRGDRDLSDQDVAAAVAFVVDRARTLAAGAGASSPPPEAAQPDGHDQAVVRMFLLLLGKERWR